MKRILIIFSILSIPLYSISQKEYYSHMIYGNIHFQAGDKIIMNNRYIDFFDIKEWQKQKLKIETESIIDLLNFYPKIRIEIGSHTDCRLDSTSYEMTQNIANNYRNYIISSGIDSNRIIAKGYGSSEPRYIEKSFKSKYPFLNGSEYLSCEFINSLATIEEQEIGHDLNRRIVLTILENKSDSSCYKTLDNYCFEISADDTLNGVYIRSKQNPLNGILLINSEDELKSHWDKYACGKVLEVDFTKSCIIGFRNHVGIAEKPALNVINNNGFGVFYKLIQPTGPHKRSMQMLRTWYLIDYSISDISFSVIVQRKDKFTKYIFENGKIKDIIE